MDKKYIIIGVGVLLIIVLAVLLLVGGRGKKDTSTTATASKLVIWDSSDVETDFSTAISGFTSLNPKVEVTFVKKNPATYETDSLNAIASNTGPDVWIIPSSWMPKQKNKLAAMPDKTLDVKAKKSNAQSFKETFVAAAYNNGVYDDKVYGLPLGMDTLSLYYNSEILDAAYYKYANEHPKADLKAMQKLLDTPPATWTDLAGIIKYNGANTIALGTPNIENASDILTALMLQYGAQMTSLDKSSALFHTSTNLIGAGAYPGAQALTFFTSFAKKGDPNFTWDGSLGNAYDAFIAGKLTMIIGYGQLYNQIAKDTGKKPTVAALPQIAKTSQTADLASFQMMTVPKSSPNSALAWSFINATANDASFIGQYVATKHLASPLKARNLDPNDFVQTQATMAQTWYNPDTAKVDSIFQNAISQNLSGQTAQTVIESAAAQVTALLASLKGSQ